MPCDGAVVAVNRQDCILLVWCLVLCVNLLMSPSQVVDNSITQAPVIPIIPFLTTALLLAIIIPVVVGVLCLAGLAGLLLAIIIIW